MWPKVFAQLVELLPHVNRLMPVADKYLASRTSGGKTTAGTMADMADRVHGDLGQITAANTGLYRQLQDQGAQIAEVASEARRARIASESCADRTAALEKRLAGSGIWIRVSIALLLVVVALLITIIVMLRAH